ncbi:MAG: hypothetical protein O2826_08700 [Chloroflexi bacterium]|nr:hypothetical protein [Chloroflexota bacterium]
MVIGGGVILGFVLWRLASGDGLDGGRWIIVGVVLVTGAWLTWGAADMKRSRTQQTQKPEPTVLTRYVVPPSDIEHLQVRLRGYAITSFAAVGLFLLGWSQPGTRDADIAWIPDSLVVNFPDFVYPVLAALFLLLALAALAASRVTRVANRLRRYERWPMPAEMLTAAIALSGVILGWYAAGPLVTDLSVGYVYAYSYGGLVFLSSLATLLIWDWYARPLRAASAAVPRRFRRLPTL